MNFLERDLEDIVYNADKEFLRKRGLHVRGIVKRQLSIGGYGIADLVSFERGAYFPGDNFRDKHLITVYELKKDRIDAETLYQAFRYATGIKRYLHYNRKIEANIRVVLIGRKVHENSDFTFLFDFIRPIVKVYTYEYLADGIYFTPTSGYHLVNEGFSVGPKEIFM